MNPKPDAAPKRKALLLFNPVAGSGDAAKERALIEELLEPELELRFVETEPETSIPKLIEEAGAEGIDLVIAAGGDGTVSEAAACLIGTETALAIIPRGTANALAVALFGGGLRMDPVATCCRAILAGQTRIIDTARCNDQQMLLLAGVGIECGMVKRADREKKDQWGVLAYLAGGWEEICEGEDFEATLELDGESKSFRARSIVVANAAPGTSLFAQGRGAPSFDDGFLDITVLLPIDTPWDVVKALLGLLGAALTESEAGDNVLHFRAKKVRLETSPAQSLVLDGDLAGKTPVTFSILPSSLTVIVPPTEN